MVLNLYVPSHLAQLRCLQDSYRPGSSVSQSVAKALLTLHLEHADLASERQGRHDARFFYSFSFFPFSILGVPFQSYLCPIHDCSLIAALDNHLGIQFEPIQLHLNDLM